MDRELKQEIGYRFSVEQFEHMRSIGIPEEDGHATELLDGFLFRKLTANPRQATVGARISDVFRRDAVHQLVVRVDSPLPLPPRTVSEPDVVVTRPGVRYRPAVEDVLLVVEVTRFGLEWERLEKLPLYAQLGIVEVWVVDVFADVVHVHTDPGGTTYRTVRAFAKEDEIQPVMVPEVAIRLAEALVPI